MFNFAELLVYQNNECYKHSLETSKDQTLELIYESNPDDWEYTDDDVRIYKHGLQIEIRQKSDGHVCMFEQAKRFGENGQRIEYDIIFNGQRIETFALVAIDGYSAYLPFPKAGTMIVPRDRYNLARIFNVNIENYKRELSCSELSIL